VDKGKPRDNTPDTEMNKLKKVTQAKVIAQTDRTSVLLQQQQQQYPEMTST